MKEKMKCCICGATLVGYGHNPAPVMQHGRCCEYCNYIKVLRQDFKTIKNI